MTIPTVGELSRACRETLASRRVPMPYGDLAFHALHRLDASLTPSEFQKAKEDVREKVLLRKTDNPFVYFTDPDARRQDVRGMAGLRDWFEYDGLLFNPEFDKGIEIPLEQQLLLAAAGEMGMRQRFLLTATASSPSRWQACYGGLAIEHHVAAWFHRRWPSLYAPSDNEGRWDMPCDHDFKLCIGGSWLNVDVMGPRRDGMWGRPLYKGKAMTAVHVIADWDRLVVRMRGFLTGKEVAHMGCLSAENTHPIDVLVVACNCQAAGMSYRELRSRCRG